jgi:hypothetical protein
MRRGVAWLSFRWLDLLRRAHRPGWRHSDLRAQPVGVSLG